MGNGDSPSSTYESALTDLRGSLKWLLAAAGAVAAVLVAGLQLGGLARLSTPALVASAAAAVTAIGIVLWFLLAATRVLTLPAPSVTALSNAELEASAGGSHADASIRDLETDLRWIAERRTLLLGTAGSVTELYADGLVAAAKAVQQLRAGRPAELVGRVLRPDEPADLDLALAVHADAEQRLRETEAALLLHRTRVAFERLMDRFRIGAGVFVVAVLTFAILTALGGPAPRQ